MNKYLLIALFLILVLNLNKFKTKIIKQKPKTTSTKKGMIPIGKKEFIEFMRPYALAIQNKTQIPYKFIIAQTGIETAWGKSSLLQKYFNFGGIKSRGTEKFVELMTTECDKKGVCKKIPQKFYVAPDVATGLAKYTKILLLPRYKKAFQYTDPKLFAIEIKNGGYATDPNYIKKVHATIDTIA